MGIASKLIIKLRFKKLKAIILQKNTSDFEYL